MKDLPNVERQNVKVYKNLSDKCYSIKYKGKVIGHAKNVVLSNVRFHINENGRQRVITKQSKNVHAYCCGTLEDASNTESFHNSDWTPISYNPYYAGYFYQKPGKEKVNFADLLIFNDCGVFGNNLK